VEHPLRTTWMVLGCAVLLLTGAAPAQDTPAPMPDGPGPAVLQNPTQGCYELGLYLKEHFPSMCHQPIHWMIGVDISGSMAGDRLDTVKMLLRQWMESLAAPADRVSLIAFDDEVRRFGPWHLENDRSALQTALDSELTVRLGRRGSALHAARERLLEMAMDVDRSASGYLPLTMLFADRDDPDTSKARPDFARHMLRRFDSVLAAGQDAHDQPAIEGEKQLAIVPPGRSGVVYLVALVSGGRRTVGMAPNGPPVSRRVPLFPERVITNDAGPDPWSGVRLLVALLPLVSLGGCGLLLFLLWNAPAGELINSATRQTMSIPWRSFRQPPCRIVASHNKAGLCLQPQRERLGDPIVLQASLDNPTNWSSWRTRLQALSNYEVRMEGDLWGEQVILGSGKERMVSVQDVRGSVAAGRVEFRENLRTRNLLRMAIAMIVLLMLLMVLGPVAGALLPSPPQRSVTTQSYEDLCG
jgi:von Willebrand factor type A domain